MSRINVDHRNESSPHRLLKLADATQNLEIATALRRYRAIVLQAYLQSLQDENPSINIVPPTILKSVPNE